jgi:alpha-D-xyloside xylohydrolase
MKPYLSILCVATLMTMTHSVTAQERYKFDCKDYVSTDDSRAPQSQFNYDNIGNTFTVKAVGNNNVAFKMDKVKDNCYYITNTQRWFIIHAKNISTATGNSLIWWFMGSNNPGCGPDKSISCPDGSVLLLWDMKNNTAINKNIYFNSLRIDVSSNGNEYIHAIGLTAKSSIGGTISDINYYSNFEAAAIYPTLMTTMGYDSGGKTLTQELKTKIDSLITIAKNKIESASADNQSVDSLKRTVTEVNNQLSTIGDTDYNTAYKLFAKIQNALAYFVESPKSVSYKKTDNGIEGMIDSLNIKIVFYKDDIVRIYKSYLKSETKKSLAVIKTPESGISLNYKETSDSVFVSSASLTVAYCIKKGCVRVKKNGSNIVDETSYYMAPTMDGKNNSYILSQSFRHDSGEAIYGMGQNQNGKLNQRGINQSMEQNNMHVCIPYYQSSKGYSLYWDNYSPTSFIDGATSSQFRSTGNEIDYYVMGGENSDSVLANMRTLTGRAPMPALWNFGLYQSKERYQSANEVMAVVRTYRSQQVPLDCVVQDWQYWGDNDHWNAMNFLNPTYSNYAAMINTVHSNNAKLMISIWANFGKLTEAYKELNPIGRLIDVSTYPTNCGVKPYDAYSTTARDIYWKYLYNGLCKKGIDAYWMDSSEPDYYGNLTDNLDYMSENGGTWRSLRNAFPLAHVGGVYTHHRAESALDSKRVCILTRSAFAGQQRYGSNTWSGDITSSWSTLATQIPAACNLSACGIPYWNCDIGGFFVGSYSDPLNNDAWKRLYMRWTQFSTFTPMMRFHGTNCAREIYQFGSAGDANGYYDQLLKYIRIRYCMIPYMYSTAWQVTANGETFMKALPLAFDADKTCVAKDINDEYMFGKSFLVAPVLSDNTTSRQVYLPAGVKWIDFWTGKTYGGGTIITKTAPVNILPLFIPAGTILPWGPDVQYATEKAWDNLEIRIYPGKNGIFTLYEDENDNYNYEKGAYSEIPFTYDDTNKTLTIGHQNGSFPKMLQSRTFNIVVVSETNGIGDRHATSFDASVRYDGQEININLNKETGITTPTISTKENMIYVNNNIITLNSNTNCYKNIYAINGTKVCKVELKAGKEKNISIRNGIYVVR